VLTDSRKQPDPVQLEQLVARSPRCGKPARNRARHLRRRRAGMGALGYEKRPAGLAELQACAAVGQSRLMAIYADLFARPTCTSRRCCSRMTTRTSRAPPQRAQHARHAARTRRRAHHHETTPCRSPNQIRRQRQTVAAGSVAAARRFARHFDHRGRRDENFSRPIRRRFP